MAMFLHSYENLEGGAGLSHGEPVRASGSRAARLAYLHEALDGGVDVAQRESSRRGLEARKQAGYSRKFVGVVADPPVVHAATGVSASSYEHPEGGEVEASTKHSET